MKPNKSYPEEVYLNGTWLKPEEAKVSVFDRGFMLGDGIYEVAPFYEGKTFKLKEHLQRLQYCLNEIQIVYDPFSLEPVIFEALERAGLGQSDAAVYIQITRGVAPRTHYYPEVSKPNLLLYVFPVSLEAFEKKSWKAAVTEDKRWHRCDIKSISLLANSMANEAAISAGFDEMLLTRNGYFTEGSHTSIFFVKNGNLYTHPEGPEILSGITRAVVIKLCEKLNIKLIEKAVHIDELVEVDEIFVTGTTTQIIPINLITQNDRRLYLAKNIGITHKLQQLFIEETRG